MYLFNANHTHPQMLACCSSVYHTNMCVCFFPVRLNASRTVSGILRGFDPYMNLVLDDCVEERSSQQKFNVGMVVRTHLLCYRKSSCAMICSCSLFLCLKYFFGAAVRPVLGWLTINNSLY